MTVGNTDDDDGWEYASDDRPPPSAEDGADNAPGMEATQNATWEYAPDDQPPVDGGCEEEEVMTAVDVGTPPPIASSVGDDDAPRRLLGVLRRTALDAPSDPWTHVVACADDGGGGWRSRVTDPAAARALYEGAARLGSASACLDHGLAVLERRLSSTVRLSVEVEVAPGAAATDAEVLQSMGRVACALSAPWAGCRPKGRRKTESCTINQVPNQYYAAQDAGTTARPLGRGHAGPGRRPAPAPVRVPPDRRRERPRTARQPALLATFSDRFQVVTQACAHMKMQPGLAVGRDQAMGAWLRARGSTRAVVGSPAGLKAVQTAFGAGGSMLVGVRVRGLASHEPLYGTRTSDGAPAMVMRAVLDGDGRPHRDWRRWLADEAAGLAPHFHIGHGERWPVPCDGVRAAHLVGALASINPLGAPLLRLPPADGGGAADGAALCVPPEQREAHRWLVRAVSALRQHRVSAADARRAGALLHAASGGADWGLAVWMILWAPPPSLDDIDNGGGGPSLHRLAPGRQMELLAEWWTLRETETALEPEALMLELLREHLDANEMGAFLAAARESDNADRTAPPEGDEGVRSVLAQMGSLTHRDLARFLHQELRGRVVCTSTTGARGGGIWYAYIPRTHRWAYDPEGTEVMRLCVQILDREVRKLRLCIARSVPPPPPASGGKGAGGKGGGGGGGGFIFSANFPELCDPTQLQRSLLVHLDTMVGDVRWMQSTVRALAERCHRDSFAERLDTRNLHLIPFANGVLDLDARRLRPGRASDLLQRGPAYAWEDFPAEDGALYEMETMLCRIFTVWGDPIIRCNFPIVKNNDHIFPMDVRFSPMHGHRAA